MSIPTEARYTVRTRANFACEYCGVAEIDAGGELTIDHYRPISKSGSDALDNRLYCCVRCNQYKADYAPAAGGALLLWNPRVEPRESHFILLADGSIYPITATGEFTLRLLRLNRPALVAYRRRNLARTEQVRLVERYQETIRLLEQMNLEVATLLREQQQLLSQQQRLLEILLRRR